MVSQRNRNYKFKVGSNTNTSNITNPTSANFGLNTMIGGNLINNNFGIGYLTKRVGNTFNNNVSAYATNATTYHQNGSSS